MHNVTFFRRNIRPAVLAFALLTGSCPAESIPSEPSAYVVVGGGVFGVVDHHKTIFGVVELQPALRIGPFGTWIALQASDREYYLGAGLLYHWYLTNRVFVTPSVGAGLYAEHNGTDLGHLVEFRTGVECGYDFKKAGRISAGAWHISNSRLDSWNPGTELVAVRYAIPLSRH